LPVELIKHYNSCGTIGQEEWQMTTRITAGAFLVCGGKVLLIKRGMHNELSTGKWAGVGGHLDLEDIKNPRTIDFSETCYREIYEEAGIERNDIRNLRLRYIAMRKAETEIRFHYHYFGEIDEIELPKCSEGDFFWVEVNEISGLEMSPSVGDALNHWMKNPHDNEVYFLVIDSGINQ
jgi:8-oxo-dGTP diphosphatase